MPEPQWKRQAAAFLLAAALLIASPVSALASDDEDTVDGNISLDSWIAELDGDTGEEPEEEAPAKTAEAAGPSAELLNNIALNPTDPKSQALEALVDDILDEILTDGMTTAQQIKACYDYIVANTTYGSHMSRINTPVSDGVTCADIYNAYGEVEGAGAVALTARVGMCNAYNSAFILMARKIGLDAYLVEGSTRNGGGGYSYHKWTEVNIDGSIYLFDPQLEQSLVASGLPRYTVFCKTYDQVPGRYSKY